MASRPDQHWALAPMLHRHLDGGPRRRASAATHAASLVVALAGAGPASTGAAMDVRLAPIPAPPDNPPPRPARGRGGTRRRCGTGCGRVCDARVHPSPWRRAAARGTDPASKRRNKCSRQPGCSSALPELRENPRSHGMPMAVHAKQLQRRSAACTWPAFHSRPSFFLKLESTAPVGMKRRNILKSAACPDGMRRMRHAPSAASTMVSFTSFPAVGSSQASLLAAKLRRLSCRDCLCVGCARSRVRQGACRR